MKRIRSIALAAALISMASVAVAEEHPYPPMRFYSSFSKDTMLEKLRTAQQFENLDNEATGSAIVIQVRHQTRMTAGGSAAALSSAVLAGSTLGLLPVVSNDDLVISYDVLVHGDKIATFEYVENFTEVDSMYDTNFNTLDGPVLEWAESTVEMFLADLQEDGKVNELVEEYRYYFGSAPAVADNVED